MKTLLMLALLISAFSVRVHAQDDSGDSITIDDSEMPSSEATPATYDDSSSESSMPASDEGSEGDYEVIE